MSCPGCSKRILQSFLAATTGINYTTAETGTAFRRVAHNALRRNDRRPPSLPWRGTQSRSLHHSTRGLEQQPAVSTQAEVETGAVLNARGALDTSEPYSHVANSPRRRVASRRLHRTPRLSSGRNISDRNQRHDIGEGNTSGRSVEVAERANAMKGRITENSDSLGTAQRQATRRSKPNIRRRESKAVETQRAAESALHGSYGGVVTDADVNKVLTRWRIELDWAEPVLTELKKLNPMAPGEQAMPTDTEAARKMPNGELITLALGRAISEAQQSRRAVRTLFRSARGGKREKTKQLKSAIVELQGTLDKDDFVRFQGALAKELDDVTAALKPIANLRVAALKELDRNATRGADGLPGSFVAKLNALTALVDRSRSTLVELHKDILDDVPMEVSRTESGHDSALGRSLAARMVLLQLHAEGRLLELGLLKVELFDILEHRMNAMDKFFASLRQEIMPKQPVATEVGALARQAAVAGEAGSKRSPKKRAAKAEGSPVKKASNDNAQWKVKNLDQWSIQKFSLDKKLNGEAWNPKKRLSPDTLDGIRQLHKQDPTTYTTPVLAKKFEVSPDAIRRILKSKWEPSEEEEEERRERWVRRGEAVWSRLVELGVKPPQKWREMGVGKAEPGQLPKWKKAGKTSRQVEEDHIAWGEPFTRSTVAPPRKVDSSVLPAREPQHEFGDRLL